MACVAELRLRDFKQTRFILKAMDAMATGAAKTGVAMSRAFEVGMCPLMATETGFVYLLRGSLAEAEYLADITAALDVRPPRPMTALAGCSFTTMHQRQARVWIVTKLFRDFAVAGLARF